MGSFIKLVIACRDNLRCLCTYFMKKNILLLVTLIGFCCIVAVSVKLTQTKKTLERETMPDTSALLAKAKMEAVAEKACLGEVSHMEVLYFPSSIDHAAVSGPRWVEAGYTHKLDMVCNKTNAKCLKKPLCEMFSSIKVSTHKLNMPEYRWICTLYGMDKKKLLSIYGSSSNDVLLDNNVTAHFDGEFVNWIYTLFGDTR